MLRGIFSAALPYINLATSNDHCCGFNIREDYVRNNIRLNFEVAKLMYNNSGESALLSTPESNHCETLATCAHRSPLPCFFLIYIAARIGRQGFVVVCLNILLQ